MLIKPHNPYSINPPSGEPVAHGERSKNENPATQRVGEVDHDSRDGTQVRSSTNQSASQAEQHPAEQRQNESAKPAARGAEQIDEKDQALLRDLAQRDREVRAHEAAHKATAGQYANGGPTYDFKVGPDGKRYAVGGEVKIDVSAVPNDPHATKQKAQVIRAAALAPAQPSAQDRAVASQASQLAVEAQNDILNAQQQGGQSERHIEANEKSGQSEAVRDNDNDNDDDARESERAARSYADVAAQGSGGGKGVIELLNVFA